MNNDIFSPFKIKRFDIKNRIGVAPMTRMSSTEDSIPRKDVLDFLVTRAKNGTAIVYTEAIVTDYESAQGYPGQSRMLTQRQIDAWLPVTEAIRENGSISICQIFHCGRMAWQDVNPAKRVIAPSPLTPTQHNPLTGIAYEVPDEMSQFDIDHVINGFVQTAQGAIKAGFDGVEIHCAHGYLVSQFLSSYSNKRKDRYGGSMPNRFRFAGEIIEAVRKVVPEEKLLVARISNWGIADMEVSLFANSAEWQEMVQLFDGSSIDALSVSTYDYSQKAFGTDKNMAALTREKTQLPIMICGKIHDRATAVDALKDADILLSGKSMLLNPQFAKDISSDKALPLYSSDQANIAYTATPLP
ncbi:MAG: NADH-dependent flavin oxidoreductase [Desulfamplus sp.]|nr:NADH-dependent flavin oxidoreductase [Desulfamplus sp.]